MHMIEASTHTALLTIHKTPSVPESGHKSLTTWRFTLFSYMNVCNQITTTTTFLTYNDYYNMNIIISIAFSFKYQRSSGGLIWIHKKNYRLTRSNTFPSICLVTGWIRTRSHTHGHIFYRQYIKLPSSSSQVIELQNEVFFFFFSWLFVFFAFVCCRSSVRRRRCRGKEEGWGLISSTAALSLALFLPPSSSERKKNAFSPPPPPHFIFLRIFVNLHVCFLLFSGGVCIL